MNICSKKTLITNDVKLRVQLSRAARRACEREAEHYEEPPDPVEELDMYSSIETMLANETMTKHKPTNLNSLMPKETCLMLPPAAWSVCFFL